MLDFTKVPCSKDDCLFVEIGNPSTTLAYYPPIFNKRGENVNPDKNTTIGTVFCRTCRKYWEYKYRYPDVEFKEVPETAVTGEIET